MLGHLNFAVVVVVVVPILLARILRQSATLTSRRDDDDARLGYFLPLIFFINKGLNRGNAPVAWSGRHAWISRASALSGGPSSTSATRRFAR
jgi:hypothetical protein